MRLLLSELVANSVTHSGLAAPDEVAIAIRSIPGGLRVEVVDEGVGIEAGRRALSEGYGLYLVEQLSERWGYSNHPTTVWFEVDGGV